MANLGNLIRLRSLSPSELPAHPDLSQLQTVTPAVAPHTFIEQCLNEGFDFMTQYLPHHFQVKSGTRQSAPSAAQVELLVHDIKPAEVPSNARGSQTEPWFARKSVHENVAVHGTASWEEFDHGLRLDHSKNEMAYTDSVLDAHPLLTWANELHANNASIAGWSDVDMCLMEMLHKLPAPFEKRVFPLLVITARRSDKFIVIQIPFDATDLSQSKYAQSPGCVQAMYCSIELVELTQESTKIEWRMAMASDAKGVLPRWMQKLGVSGPIIKDVGIFIGWCAANRA